MPRRDSILPEEASILQHDEHAAAQYILRLQAPQIAAAALPGSFVHIRCDPGLPMRRPMSIMRADRKRGWIDVLYKAHGLGTGLLAQQAVGGTLSLLGPIGQPFKLQDYRARPLLIGGGVGIPPMVFLAEHLRASKAELHPFVLMGSEVPFPFPGKPSQIIVDGIPPDVIACMPLLEDWGIASRLTSLNDYSGCFTGYVTELARLWLDSLAEPERAEVEIFSCGPTPMLQAVAELAQAYRLPCQVSLEEYMACAVGGCAGCAVAVHKNGETSMQRVCVDGPVFEADEVFPAAA
ncbi:MAG: dihydroorotate dehydrogenase electron transfer subunit [Gammaproteobacteria bacterium]